MTNMELGIQRLYYVLWALWTGGLLLILVIRIFEGRAYLAEGFWTILIAAAPPPALMFAVRWVYRGFRPLPSKS